MNPSFFQAKRPDGRSISRVIYDHIEPRVTSGELPIGSILSHETLRGLLEEKELQGYYSAVKGASKALQKNHSRALQAVRGAGYCLVGGASQVEYGQSFRRKGQRNVRNGLALIKSADRSVMSPADRSWADKVENGMAALVSIASMHEEKLAEHNAAIEALRSARIHDKKTTATKDEVEELRRMMDEFLRAHDGK